MHLSFLTSHILLFCRFCKTSKKQHFLLFYRFCKTSKKTTFSVFLSFFFVKLSKSQPLKLNISRTVWPILMILVSPCRILNSLSDEIYLFWRFSSPLRLLTHVGFLRQNGLILSEVFLYMERSKNQEKNIS